MHVKPNLKTSCVDMEGARQLLNIDKDFDCNNKVRGEMIWPKKYGVLACVE